MYIDYSSWDSYEYKVSALTLDLHNPRLGYLENVYSQTDILKVLIEKEKVYDLARKISEEGYFVGEEPIICIENNRKVVLEGNRRVAALKLLRNPTKYLAPAKARILQNNIIKNGIDVNGKVRCYISPNRLLANPIIYERHRGDAVQKWKTGNQYAYVARLYQEGLSIDDICILLNETRSNILGPLKIFNLFIEGQEIYSQRGIDINPSNFDITNLERFCSLPEVSEFLGIRFNNDDGTLHICLPKEEFEIRIIETFNVIIQAENFSREYNKREDLIDLLNQVKSSSKVNLEIKFNKDFNGDSSKSENRKKNLEEEKSKVNLRRKKKSKSTFINTIIPRETQIEFGNEKLDTLFNEMKVLSLDKVYSFAFLIRAYLEQSLYYYLATNNLLSECNKNAASENLNNNKKKLHTLLQYLYKGKKEISEEDFQKCMEILKFIPSKEYCDIGLKAMLEYVVKYRIQDAFDSQTLKNVKDYIGRIKDGLDLAIHNINNIVDVTHNKRAWYHLEPLFKFFSENIPDE